MSTIFAKKKSEYKDCNSKRGLKHYYENEGKISTQRLTHYEKIRRDYYRTNMIDIYISKKWLGPMLH